MRVASYMTLEASYTGANPLEGQISALSDAILSLQVERREDHSRRTVQIVKARGTDHDLNVQRVPHHLPGRRGRLTWRAPCIPTTSACSSSASSPR